MMDTATIKIPDTLLPDPFLYPAFAGHNSGH